MPSNVVWEKYPPETSRMMVLDKNIECVENPILSDMDFMTDILYG